MEKLVNALYKKTSEIYADAPWSDNYGIALALAQESFNLRTVSLKDFCAITNYWFQEEDWPMEYSDLEKFVKKYVTMDVIVDWA